MRKDDKDGVLREKGSEKGRGRIRERPSKKKAERPLKAQPRGTGVLTPPIAGADGGHTQKLQPFLNYQRPGTRGKTKGFV